MYISDRKHLNAYKQCTLLYQCSFVWCNNLRNMYFYELLILQSDIDLCSLLTSNKTCKKPYSLVSL